MPSSAPPQGKPSCAAPTRKPPRPARGLLAEPGSNSDVAYSHQRADEVSLRLAEIARALAVAEGHVQQFQDEAAAEQARAGLLNASDLRSPIDGMLWNLNSIGGERAATGDSVLTLVDCRREFLLVEIPQERVPEVVLRGQARVRLSGESVERTGTVVAVSPDLQKDVRHKLAVFPEGGAKDDLATVRVALDPQPNETPEDCLVGRTARVLIPTATSNNVARLAHRYF